MNARTTALRLLCVALLGSSSSAYAGYLFDTGTPNPVPNEQNPPFTSAIVRGVQFTVTAPVTITSVEHYASVDAPDDPNNPNDGVAEVRMYIRPNASTPCNNQFGDFPCPVGIPGDSSTDLFSSTFNVANTYPNGPTSDPVPQWIGVSGLNWLLGPGTYWVMRQQTRAATGVAVLFSPFCSDTTGCTNFVGQTYEDSNAGANAWTPNSARTGWRVGIRAVPEPGSLALLGLGLAGLALSRRRRAA